jgi:GxxExxY protein
MEKNPQNELTELVIGLAMKIHGTLGPGFVEFVYRNALIYEMRKSGLTIESERFVQVFYEDIVVGNFNTDLIINGWLLLELKAVANLLPQHEIQAVNYLTAIKQEFGLLINFGAASLQFKRKYRRPQKSDPLDLRE